MIFETLEPRHAAMRVGKGEKMDKLLHAGVLLILAVLVGHGLEWQAGGIMCTVAAGFRSIQAICDGIGEIAYADFVGDPIE